MSTLKISKMLLDFISMLNLQCSCLDCQLRTKIKDFIRQTQTKLNLRESPEKNHYNGNYYFYLYVIGRVANAVGCRG